MTVGGNMGFQCEQRVLAVFERNRWKLEGEDAMDKLRHYMAVRYAISSVRKAVAQLCKRGLLDRTYSGGCCIRIVCRSDVTIQPWAKEELGRAIGQRRRNARKGQMDHKPPQGWLPVPQSQLPKEKPVPPTDSTKITTTPPAEPAIDYRALADSLLLQVTEILAGSGEQNEAAMEALRQERDEALEAYAKLEERSVHNQRESEHQLRAAGYQLDEKEQTITSLRRRAQIAEDALAKAHNEVRTLRESESNGRRFLKSAEEQILELEAKLAKLEAQASAVQDAAKLEGLLGSRGVQALQGVIRTT